LKEDIMYRTALLIFAALLAGCAGFEQHQQAMPWERGNERFQQCLEYASVSHCRDEIYGHGG
jgi:hypothetical protein